MDCNREEALRAKQIAEKKMENKEFSAALKIAQKAQQLYPELENISQLMLVCEVHISSEKKSFGSDKDWYSILKIDPSSDDLSIKRQYRKLALVLHPDKNKFSGSTDAFKLIGEAQRVLLDPEKRSLHDNKRRAFSTTNWATKQPIVRQPHVHQHSWNPVFPQGHSGNFAGDNFTGGRSGTGTFQFQRGKTSGSAVRLTFWTVCPFCSVRYQFYRDDVLNKVVHCQTCKKTFTAYELNIHAASPPVPQRNPIPVPTPTPVPTPVPVPPKPKPNETQNVNKKRKKKVDESSESSDDGTRSSSEEEEEEDEDSGDENSTESDENAPGNVDKKPENHDSERVGEQPRRSARPKRNVSYKENMNDHDHDDEAAPSKKRAPPPVKPEPEDTFWKAEVREPVKESQKQESQINSEATKDDVEDLESEPEPELEPESEPEPELFECPDPEFNDFEKDRKEDSFAPGQIWALYDTEDAMPRFYALIRKVLSPGFNLQITWLKPVPETDDETNWVDEELPVSCGNFKRGKPDKAEDLPMFSHLVTWEEGKKGIFNIIPRKGETWALFRDWNINWSNDGTGKYEYEFVEVLSDYDEGIGFRVSYLEKLAGFRCLFGRKEDGEMVIPESDKYRFSHMVPSCRMSGEEREGVPKGSYELDPAGLPASAFE